MIFWFISTLKSNCWGGSEELWSAAAKHALSEGHRVIISAQFQIGIHERFKEIETAGALLEFIRPEEKRNVLIKITDKINRTRNGYPNAPQHYYEFLNKIKTYNPDCICISQGGPFEIIYNLEVVWLLDQLRIPYFLISHFNYEHHTYSYPLIERIRKIVLNAKKVYFISQRNLEVSKRQIASSMFNNYEIIKNPCKVKVAYPIKMPAGNIIYFANIARLECNAKGQDLLFEVLSKPKWKERSWILNLYGDGVDKRYLVELAEFYGICEKINFAGHVKDIGKIWEANHILLLPSIGEGTPLALVEAMQCGRTAVVTDVGDNAVLVEDNVTGFVAAAPTLRLFDEALERAWQNKSNWELFGKNAFNFIQGFIDRDAGKTLLTKMMESIREF